MHLPPSHPVLVPSGEAAVVMLPLSESGVSRA